MVHDMGFTIRFTPGRAETRAPGEARLGEWVWEGAVWPSQVEDPGGP